ncbi:hypothetical protein Nepgr_025486 [Nepenthes gracilis]|uniref:Uncharacterized protein n=1 Tax=Nepenthes gracilis TaxID=150966 RepID=A0AAD3T509_NEPGR|nr:hypothetical protein Nepgr_025486 [Nepenthes gracilis]
MGCASSKIDDLPAVFLCRQRLSFIDDAIRQRHALAEAHVAYIESLKSVGGSLRHFFDAAESTASKVLDSPALDMPARRMGDPDEPKRLPSTGGHIYNSDSGSYYHPSDSDNENSGSESRYYLHSRSLLPHQDDIYRADETLTPFPGIYMQMNYMKQQATHSVAYEWRSMGPETAQMGESSYYDPSYHSSYPNPISNYNNNSYGYMHYDGDDGGMGAFLGSSPPPPNGSSARQGGVPSQSSSKSPPPPPPPPSTSAWDFLNPFESIGPNYPPYTPSRDSREVREEEGIPDLEDENYQQEDVKEVHGDQKFVDDTGGGEKRAVEEEDKKASGGVAVYGTAPSVPVEDNPAEYDVHTVDEKVVRHERRSEEQGDAVAFKGNGGLRNASEVLREIQVQFDRASASGSELANILEVRKLSHQRKNAANQVSTKMLQAVTLPSTPKDTEASSSALDFDEEIGLRSGKGNLSSTLEKLHLWEKKLLEEVKAEENMRVIHDRKLQKLKHLDERGAEAHKVDATRTLVRNLSTKIRISIQVVDKISVTINNLRDEELWPQLNELIQGLATMWKVMLECHQSQFQAVNEANFLDAVAFPENPTDSYLKAMMLLEHDLINWTLKFTNWVGVQKAYARALNSWLLKCFLYEPEETPDGIAPFLPGKAGMPSVFVICDQWSRALEIISEKEVVDSMQAFSITVVRFREQTSTGKGNDINGKVKNLEREDLKMQKEIQAMEKKMIMLSGDRNGVSLNGHVGCQSDTKSKGTLHYGLRHVFEAMDRFTAELVKAYEELLQRSKEEVVREHVTIS